MKTDDNSNRHVNIIEEIEQTLNIKYTGYSFSDFVDFYENNIEKFQEQRKLNNITNPSI